MSAAWRLRSELAIDWTPALLSMAGKANVAAATVPTLIASRRDIPEVST